MDGAFKYSSHELLRVAYLMAGWWIMVRIRSLADDGHDDDDDDGG